MVTDFHVDSDDPAGLSFKVQRCLRCFDFIVLKPADGFVDTCPYCGTLQMPYFYSLMNGKSDTRLEELLKRLSHDSELRLREDLLLSLRVWQFKIRNGIDPYVEIPEFFQSIRREKLNAIPISDEECND
ncbi:hypothetical protein HRbin04_01319 [archaeon HR04]|nr:hypothetical protein HRbin04_01319 [archaeon HR04]